MAQQLKILSSFSVSSFGLPNSNSNININVVPSSIKFPRSRMRKVWIRAALVSPEQIPPNALRLKDDSDWSCGFSLGVDLGLSRTGLALSRGYSIRPLTVVELRGQKLELKLMEIAEKQEVDEFIIGLPKSADGQETPQSNKVRSVAGRFAVRAAHRGWRVYLQDEHGTTTEAMNLMLAQGLKKSARQVQVDAYAATMVLGRYFSSSGKSTELVLPKQLELQEKILRGPPRDPDFFDDDLED